MPKEAVNKCKEAWEILQKDPLNYLVSIFVGALAISFTGGILGGPVFSGIIKAARKLQKGEKVQISDSFSGMSFFVPTLILSLLLSLGYGAVVLVDVLLSLLMTLLLQIPVAGVIFAIILVLAMIVISVTAGLILSVLYLQGLILITEENLGPVDALKKAAGWMKKKKGTSIEFMIAQFLCSLGTLVPVVGAYFSIGMSLLVGVLYYDEEKAAGGL
jgi:hypothetical protein